MEYLKSATIRVPQGGDKVFKDECVHCFDSPESDDGLYVCLSTFLGFCQEHVHLHVGKTANRVFIHLKNIQKEPMKVEETREDPPKKKPTRMAIGVEGGFQVEGEEKVEYDEFNAIVILVDGGDPLKIELPNADLPMQIQMSIAGVLAADTATYQDQVASWDGEKRIVSKYADGLVQLHNGVKIPPRGWKCSKCDLTDNLWLNLTDGSILCGRKYCDGSGGNNHAVDHYGQTKYPLAVKLGTITPDGADVFSYDEDNMVEDPHLSKHLAHFGINITQMEKTDKTMAELEIDINMRIREWDVIQEAGKKLTPLYGPGYTGMRNLGNSCYMNSVMQVLFTLPEFQQRYVDMAGDIASGSPADPSGDFDAQMAKLGHGLLSGQYSQPPEEAAQASDQSEQCDEEQKGISPQMFKTLIGRGHPEFSTSRQQDAQEFLMHLVSVVDRAERANGGPRNPVDAFRFKVEERIQCVRSTKVRYTSREDTVLSLPIPIDAILNKEEVAAYEEKKAEAQENKETLAPGEIVRPRISMLACLESFAAPEYVDGFYSSALQARSTAQKRTRFETFPKYLMIQMEKFTLGDDWIPKKLDVALNILDELDLTHLRGTGLQPTEKELPEGEEPVAANEPQIDEAIVQQLADMGFDKQGCRKAVYHTNNQGVEAAMNWVLEHMGDPDFTDPLRTAGQSTASDDAPVNEESVAMIISMGFTKDQAIKALKATDNNLERAADWIFSHAHELDSMDVRSQGNQGTGPKFHDGPGISNGDGRRRIFSTRGQNGNEFAHRLHDKGFEYPSNLILLVICPLNSLISSHLKYRLVAFISHMGTSTMCGHYVCHIMKEGRWVIFNDRKVALSENPPKELAYLYLYQRVDS